MRAADGESYGDIALTSIVILRRGDGANATVSENGNRVLDERIHRISPWFEVVEARVERAGEVANWFYQRHPGAAVVVPITARGTVMLSAEYRVSAGAVVLEVPGGRIDPGESAQTAALREMREEIGARPGEVRFLGRFWNSPGSSNEQTHAFAALDVEVVEPVEGTREVRPEQVIASAAGPGPVDVATLTSMLLAARAGLFAAASGAAS